MANKTTNYELTKPLASEFYDIADQNGNMDIIDAALKKNADAIAGVKAGAITSAEREKLTGIEAGANKYVHPLTHPASMIEETEEIKMMTASERSKLAGIAAGANKYTHPATHPASMITGLAEAATSGSYNDLLNKPELAAVAVSGSYDDLTNKPSNPSVFVTSYVGTGGSDDRTVTLPFTPALLIAYYSRGSIATRINAPDESGYIRNKDLSGSDNHAALYWGRAAEITIYGGEYLDLSGYKYTLVAFA